MSSNFWASSHCHHWLVERTDVEASKSLDLKYATKRQLACLGIWFANLIQKLGKRLQMRQVPIATATVFFRRFYLKNSYCETNPYLVLAACCYVAAKVEETPVHIKSVVIEAKVVFAEYHIKTFPAEHHRLGEMEFYLLEDIDFHLVVFHPYRALVAICGREPADSGTFMPLESMDNELERIKKTNGRGSGEGVMEIEEGVLQVAWFTINDTYRTDVCLMYPPYVIALAALYISFTINASSAQALAPSTSSNNTSNVRLRSSDPGGKPTTAAEFLASFEVSLPVLLACVQDIITVYPLWNEMENNLASVPGVEGGGGKGVGESEAEALVRRMIETHMASLGTTDDGNSAKATLLASAVNANTKKRML